MSKGCDLLEPQDCESGGRDRREVGARSLHPQHTLLVARMVDRRPLRGRVAATLIGQSTVRSEQVRAVDERVEGTQSCGACIVPPILWRGNSVEHSGDAHARTSNIGKATALANRSRASRQTTVSCGS